MHPTYAGTGMHTGTFTRLAYKQPQASKGDQEANAGMYEGGMKMPPRTQWPAAGQVTSYIDWA